MSNELGAAASDATATPEVEKPNMTEMTLEEYNDFMRRLQIDGPEDPDNFKMPDGRTLTEVRNTNAEAESQEGVEELKRFRASMREQSLASEPSSIMVGLDARGNVITQAMPESDSGGMTQPAQSGTGGDGGNVGTDAPSAPSTPPSPERILAKNARTTNATPVAEMPGEAGSGSGD